MATRAFADIVFTITLLGIFLRHIQYLLTLVPAKATRILTMEIWMDSKNLILVYLNKESLRFSEGSFGCKGSGCKQTEGVDLVILN
jgi:hypothetical protein